MSGPILRILLIGARGVVGSHVHAALAPHHTVICAGLEPPRSTDEIQLDLSDSANLVTTLNALAPLNAIISTAGRARFGLLKDAQPVALADSVYGLGLQDKLIGQVNLVLAARGVLTPGGSITLTSGTTSTDAVLGAAGLSMANGALESWARAAATELPNGIRLNVVSPSLVEGTSAPMRAAFPGFAVISGELVALAYLRCLQSGITGQVLRV